MNRKITLLIISVGLLSSCAHEEKKKPVVVKTAIRQMQCPPADLVSSGITRLKPGTAEELARQTVKAPAVGGNQQWNINSMAAGQQLYLSCYYGPKKIMAYKLPLEKEFCMGRDAANNTAVECLKK